MTIRTYDKLDARPRRALVISVSPSSSLLQLDTLFHYLSFRSQRAGVPDCSFVSVLRSRAQLQPVNRRSLDLLSLNNELEFTRYHSQTPFNADPRISIWNLMGDPGHDLRYRYVKIHSNLSHSRYVTFSLCECSLSPHLT